MITPRTSEGYNQRQNRAFTVRTFGLVPRRPEPPRRLGFSAGLLSWEPPSDESTVTHYRLYANTDAPSSLVREVPVGQHYLADNLTANRVFISSFNAFTGLESERLGLEGPIEPSGLSSDGLIAYSGM